MKTIYEAGHPDLNDGYCWVTVGFFASEAAAWDTLRGMDLRIQGIGKQQGAVKPRYVYETAAEFEHWEQEETRRAALAKLTPHERKALGFNK